MAAYDEIKKETDALRPGFRKAKLRATQLSMAEDKYGTQYADTPSYTDKTP